MGVEVIVQVCEEVPVPVETPDPVCEGVAVGVSPAVTDEVDVIV